MFSYLVGFIMLFSIITAIFSGRIDAATEALLSAPQRAVELTISVGCGICLWNGVMETALQSGVLEGAAKLFSPVISFLFPDIKTRRSSAAMQAVCMNLAANLLGLGAAAAPAGIRAVQEFQKDSCDPSVATDNSVLIIILNTASLQLIPTTAAILRQQAGSAAPMEIIPAVWLTSALSVTVGIAAAKCLSRLHSSPLRLYQRRTV